MRIWLLRIMRSEVIRITPDTSKTQVRGTSASMHALSEPDPLALILVTLKTVPPRPAFVSMPNPAAPGITGSACTVAAPHKVSAVANKVAGLIARRKGVQVDERLAGFIADDPRRNVKAVRIRADGRVVGILWHALRGEI
jgi:hypothetical protein